MPIGWKSVFRSALCFLLVLVIVFCVVALPLAVPAQAVVPVAAAGVIWLFLRSAGYTLILDPSSGTDVMWALVDNFNAYASAAEKQEFDLLCEMAEKYPTSSDFAQVNISRNSYKVMSEAVQRWIDSRVTADGTIKIDVANAPPILLKKENAYKGSESTAINAVKNAASLVTETSFRAVLGNSVIFYGKPEGYVFSSSYLGARYSQTYLSCNKYGGNGTHGKWFDVKTDGTLLEPKTSCIECSWKYPSSVGYAFFVVEGNESYDLVYGTIDSSGKFSSGYYTDLYSNAFSTSIVGTAQAVDVPVEKDKDYAGGVVLGKWDGLIGQVGSAADTLPFNIPMTEGALGTLTPTAVLPKELQVDTSTDVPAEGEIEMPSVDALKLPKGIVNKFPFCIPFDLYRGLTLLDAPAISPRFEIPFKYGDYFDYTIEINFDRFDTAIALIRWFELALFTVGLAFATRRLLKV